MSLCNQGRAVARKNWEPVVYRLLISLIIMNNLKMAGCLLKYVGRINVMNTYSCIVVRHPVCGIHK
jgi:hypothetical protein